MNWIAIYPEIFLLVMACVIMLADLFFKDADHRLAYGLTLFTLLALAVTSGAYYASGLDLFAMQRMVIVDPMAMLLKLFTTVATGMSLIYARRYALDRGMWGGELFSLSLFALLGQFIMISGNNLLVIYLGLELLSLSLYALVALRRDSALATEAAMKYFVLGALASGFLLYGMSMIYGATGSLDLAVVFKTIALEPLSRAALVMGVVFIVSGLAFKLGAAPFHMWIPDVYQGAPTAVVLLVGGAPKLAAFAMTIRLLVEGLFPLAMDWQQMLVVLAVLSIVVGNFAAIAQTNLKRMLAYSTIAQIGFMLLGLLSGMINGNGISASVAYSAAMFYLVIYVLTTLGTFGVIMFMAHQGFEAEDIRDFAGLGKSNPWLAGIMTFLMFSLAGLPPFAGFYAKFEVLSVLLATGRVWLVVLAVVLSVVGAYYYLRMVKTMYFDQPTREHRVQASPVAWVLMSLNGLAVLGLGILPGGLMTLCYQAIANTLH
ncbi:MAG: NADH-quinone oxidoreductase subunit NuoN [Thiomonas sp.]|uniref:NADH:ubiquinone oxidoreductase, membrane subunit N n=1 Tax=mine drainage metagenome TaxID=410659 RepID=E6PR38_9ZZZZ|nr:NADH-quinone oxidoreductase subunit NuoN [Thiomonas sp. X19]SCC93315.1 NADH-quinone oxidoreductase subunit N [Thiomonas sp. X19]